MKEYRQYYLPDGLDTDKRKWTKKHAEIYFQWFMENKADRINYFLNYFSENFVDYGESDIKRLSEKLYDRISKEDCWFIQTVSINNNPDNMQLTAKSLTNVGIPMACDFGIVFSLILEKNIEGLSWTISTADKRTLHHKSPVLVGFRKGQSSVEYDPIHYGIADSSVMLNDNNPNEWLELYKTICIMWNRKTPTVAELLERQRQGKSTNIEEIQKEMGWLED